MTTVSNAADNQITRNLRLDLWIFRNGVRQTPDMSRFKREETGIEEVEMVRLEKYFKKRCCQVEQRKKAGARRSVVREGWLGWLFNRRVMTADEGKLKKGLSHCPFSAALYPPDRWTTAFSGPCPRPSSSSALFTCVALFISGIAASDSNISHQRGSLSLVLAL